MSCDHEMLKELRERVIRTESRIVQLGDHVGANLRAKQKIEVFSVHPAYVKIDSMDVSVSRILAKLKEAGINPTTIDVYCDDLVVFTLYPPRNHHG